MYFPHADLTMQACRQQQSRPAVLFRRPGLRGPEPDLSPTGRTSSLITCTSGICSSSAYRDLMKDIPTVTIPDDHDVYQGNVWGQGGRKEPGPGPRPAGMSTPRRSSTWSTAHRSSHLPDPADPTPIEQGISVLHHAMCTGAGWVSRSSPTACLRTAAMVRGLPPSGTGRPDHYNNPAFDTADLDIEGMKLLGDRQLKFLEDWAGDWRGVDMKMALSQTVFANMATHHGPEPRPPHCRPRLQRLAADRSQQGAGPAA